MEEIKNNPEEHMMHHWEKQHRRGRFFAGLFIIGAGALFLAREMGAAIPAWFFTWQTLLIVIGLYSLLKSGFQSIGGMVMIAIGGSFLLRDYLPEYNFSNYLWPIALIVFGLFIMLRPRRGFYRARHMHRHHRHHHRHSWNQGMQDPITSQERSQGPPSPTSDDYIYINSVFGGVKKNVISKHFKGGEINCVFGGGEIDLTQSEIDDSAELQVNAVLGGISLVLPAHWQVKSELSAFLGGVEDKRQAQKELTSSSKTLVLKGTAVLGGIEIKSF